MSAFDPFHHDHINTPLVTPFEFQMVGGCRMKTGGYKPLGVWINHWKTALQQSDVSVISVLFTD